MSATPDAARSAKNNSVQTFTTALVVNLAVVAIEVAAFSLLKSRYRRIYAPRTFLPPPDKRARELPKGPWKWIPAVYNADPKQIIKSNGLDAYLFVRFLWILCAIFLPFWAVTWAVLLPVDSVHIKSGSTGLDRFTLGNTENNQGRRFAHVAIVYLLTFYVIWILRREMLRFVHLRHNFLISKSHSRLAQAKTVLITALPQELTTEDQLRQFASFVPGGVAKIWIYRDAPNLNDLHKARLDACKMLEKAEADYLRSAVKMWRREQHIKKKAQKKIKAQAKEDLHPNDPGDLETLQTPLSVLQKVSRPTHRLGWPWSWVPFSGETVDTIDWCKKEIPRLTAEIEALRKDLPNQKPHGSAMIMFNLQMAAHIMAQCVSYHQPFQMVDKWIELAPEDVVWDNIDDSAYETRVRYITSWMATIGLILVWSFPVSFAGTLSNLDTLCQKAPWLRPICELHAPVPGIIQGVLPPLFLAILFVVLPFILKILAYYEGIPRYSLISLSVYKRYFLLLFIHGFLVTTLSSGLIASLEGIINNPSETVQVISNNLPKASTFFLTYLVANGFTAASSALLQLVPLVLHYVMKILFGNTPRASYKSEFVMPTTDFGTTLPRISLLATIAFAYSVISPLVCGLAFVAFALLMFAWKFLLIWVMDQPEAFETGGLYFPLAISNLFFGLYIQQICLIVLFFLGSSQNHTFSIVEGVLMIILFVLTVGAQILIRRAFSPITNFLPMSLATKKLAQRYARQAAKVNVLPDAVHGAVSGALNDATSKIQGAEHAALDLFSRDNIKGLVRRRLRLKHRQSSHHSQHEPPMVPEGPIGNEKSNGEPPVDQQPSTSGKAPRPPSVSSHMSGQSSARSSMSGEHGDAIKLAAPAKALTSEKLNNGVVDGDNSDDDDDVDEHAFDHPSTYTDAPWIWIPKDELGMSAVLLEELKEANVEASDLGAYMDDKARVNVDRNPPDEDWSGGHDR